MRKASVYPRTILAALLTLTLLFTGCSLLPAEKAEEIPTLIEAPPSRVTTYKVEKKRIVEEIRGLARVAPTLETNLYFTQSGRMAVLNVEPGQRVKKDEILVQMETGTLEHQLQLAQIDLEMARLRLNATKTGGTPLDVKMQQLSLEKSRLQVDNLKERLEAATIRAPYDGVVQSVRGQVGQLIREYDTVVVVADPAALELQVEMRRSNEVDKLARDQDALVEVKRDEWEPGKVAQITENPDERDTFGSQIVHIELAGEPSQFDLKLGDLLSTRIIVREKKNALVIPRAALREFMGRKYVRVLDGDARREVDVEVGIETPTEVEILKGLSDGDVVIGQ